MRPSMLALMACLSPVPWGPAARGGDPTPTQMLDLLDAAINRVSSFDVRFTAQRSLFVKDDRGTPRPLTPGQAPTIYQEKFRQVFDRGKQRKEALNVSSNELMQATVWDGEIERWLDLTRASGAIQRRSQFLMFDGEDYLALYRNLAGPHELVPLFRQRSSNKVNLSGTRLVLECEPDLRDSVACGNYCFSVAADPAHGMIPEEISVHRLIEGDKVKTALTTIDELRQVAPDVWVPVKATTTFYVPTPKVLPGTVFQKVELTVDSASSAWNTTIPRDTFKLPFPEGTKVSDRIRGIQFISGLPEPDENLKSMVARARNVVPLPRPKPATNAGSGPSVGMILLISGLPLGLLVGALLIVRARRKATS